MVFFRPAKFINELKVVAICLQSHPHSHTFIMVLLKQHFLDYFESYRSAHPHSFKYSIQGSLKTLQIIKDFFFTEPTFQLNHLNCSFFEKIVIRSKSTKKETKSSRIQSTFSEKKVQQKRETETQVFSILDCNHLVKMHLYGLNDSSQFQKILSIKDDIVEFCISQQLIATSHFTLKFVIYKCFYAIPSNLSKCEKVFTFSFNQLITSMRNLNDISLQLHTSKQDYEIRLEDFKIQKCSNSVRCLDSQAQFQNYINKYQPKMEEENNQLQLLKKSLITSYFCTHLDYVQFDEGVQEISKESVYRIILVGCTSIVDRIKYHSLKVFGLYGNSNTILKSEINDLKYQITSLSYITPFDFGYTDSSGDFGLITFNLSDVGVPIVD